MTDITIISPDSKFRNVANNVVRHIGKQREIGVYQGSLQDGLAIAEDCVKKGTKIIISRGRTGELLSEKLDIPVLTIKTNSFDIIYSVREARMISDTIGIVGFPAFISDYSESVSFLEQIFKATIVVHIIEDQENINQILTEMHDEGVGVFVGGQLVNNQAEGLGFSSVLIETSEETAIEYINRAYDILAVKLKEERESELLRSIIDFVYDGVLATDKDGLITVFNPVIQRLTGFSEGEALGKPVSEIVENTRMQNVCESGQAELGEIQHIQGKAIVTNRIPIIVEGSVEGAVATFQEIEKFQKTEHSVRKKLFSKGYTAHFHFDDIIGESPAIIKAKQRGKKYAAVDSTVLILGESGTGKELFAQSIHNASKRKTRPFVAINCASLPETLLESELFGYVEGAFTGANKNGKAGLFELANQGTIFLDEIGEMKPHLQARLLRVLQEKEVMRLGDDGIIPIDVRVIAASNKDLLKLIRTGEFREDLYYRLCVLKLDLPPIRERKQDIEQLAQVLIEQKCRQMKKRPVKMDSDVIKVMTTYSWPGNVRELENTIERCVAICEDDVISLDNMPEYMAGFDINSEEDVPLNDAGRLKDAELELIKAVLKECKGNRTLTAEKLGISKSTLWRRLKMLE